MDLCPKEFERSLDQGGISGTAKRLWLKLFKRNPTKAAKDYFKKIDREYSGLGVWETAKKLLLEKRADIFAEPVIYNWDYCVKINNGRWGDCCYDWNNWVDEGIAVF